MATPVKNFAKGTVSTGYTSGATSIALVTGHGSRFEDTFPYPATWWNFTDYPDPADDPDREVVSVTNKVGDTFTIARAQEGTTATAKNIAGKTYKLVAGITAAMWQELSSRALTQSHRGLEMMRHPDSDIPASQVLFSAEAIVMDDGEEVQNWSNVVANIAASGAGGLDTGVEQASTWYEIYAIFNGTTKNALLHRAKDYFLDEDVSVNDDANHNLRDVSGNTKLSQGFQVDTAGPVEFIDVKIQKVGTPTGSFWFTIESNNGGVPNNTPLATSDKYDVSRLITTSQWVRIPFRTPASLSALTQYHLVLQGDFTISVANYMQWRKDGSAGAYARGSIATYNGTTWSADADDDFMFKVYVTENDTPVTMPSGYTQKALLGYVYNNASSFFLPFHQIGRKVFCGEAADWRITNSFTTTTPTLIDARAYLPPRTVAAQFTYANTGSAHFVIGNIRATDFTTAAANVPFVGVVRGVTANVGWEETPAPIVLDPYCGFVLAHNAGTGTLYLTGFEF